MSLLAVGTVAFDAIETSYSKTDKIVGGAASYICLSASLFTKSIHLVSIIGDDFPESTLKQYRKRNISLDGLQIVKGEKSFFWSGKYNDTFSSRETITTELNVLANFKPVVPASAMESDFVMLGNLTPAVQASVIEQMRKKPKLIALDTMNFWIDSAKGDLLKVLKKIDLLIINDEEARMLTGEHSLVKAAKGIFKLGVPNLIIKKGENGSLVFSESGKIFFAPAFPLEEVVDPTGAGDTFAGGIMGYLDKIKSPSFENLKKAVVYGSIIGSFCVEKFGTEGLLKLSHDQIRKRYREYVKLTSLD